MGYELTAWPEHRVVRSLVCAYFLIVLTVLTVLCTFRIASIDRWRGFVRQSLARKMVLFTLFDSWLFCWASAVLLFGVGSALNGVACEVGIWWCVLLYASSKITIYLFLMERLRIVHSNVKQDGNLSLKDRFESWWYRGAAVLLLGWIGVAIAMCVGRNAHLSTDGLCHIGLKLYATVSMLVVDAVVNIYLTASFLVPVFKAGFNNAKGLVKDSTIAACAALITSFANILVLAIMHGKQMSYVCLSSCVTDVALNAVILYVITSKGNRGNNTTSATQVDTRALSGSKINWGVGTVGGTGQLAASRRASALNLAGRSMGRGQMSSYPTHAQGSGIFDGVHIARTQHSVVDFPEDDDRFEVNSTYVAPTYTLPPLLYAHEEGKPFKGGLTVVTPDEKAEMDMGADTEPVATTPMAETGSSSGTRTISSTTDSPQITPIEEKATIEGEQK